MSELDYSRVTGRGFGQAGSLRPGAMSSMERRDAVTREMNDQKRESAFERRVMRQLGRASRKGDIRAGMLGMQIAQDAQDRGRPVQGGIGSYEENQSVAAGALFDRERITNEQDALLNGDQGGFDQTSQASALPSIRPGAGPSPTPLRPGASSTMDPVAPQVAMDEDPPTPSPMAERSDATLSPIDRELLAYGARTNANLRSRPGFGSRPGYGIAASRMEGAPAIPNAPFAPPTPRLPAPSRTTADRIDPRNVAATPSPIQAPSPSPLPSLPSGRAMENTRGGSDGMTDQEWASWRRGDKLMRQGATAESLATEKAQIDRNAEYRRSNYVAEDAEFASKMATMERQRQADLEEGARKSAANKASRITQNWQGERRDSLLEFGNGSTLTYAERDRGGKQYRPVGWTQEDEDATATAAEKGAWWDRAMRKAPLGGRIFGPMVGAQLDKIGKMKSSPRK